MIIELISTNNHGIVDNLYLGAATGMKIITDSRHIKFECKILGKLCLKSEEKFPYRGGLSSTEEQPTVR